MYKPKKMDVFNLKYISDMKRFAEDSEGHLRNLMINFNFLSDNENMNSGDDIDDIISSLQKHVAMSKAGKKFNSDLQLPSPIPKGLLVDERLRYTIDEETRKCLLLTVRKTGDIPPRATTVDEYMASYSAAEKNLLYDHALQNTIKIKTPPELLLPEPEEVNSNIDESKMSEEELRLKKLEEMKRERDMKRRRIAYRKKVSTKNKTLNEVTREMISNIMEALYGKIVDDNEEVKERESDQNVPKHSRHRDEKRRKDQYEERSRYEDYEHRRRDSDENKRKHDRYRDRERSRHYRKSRNEYDYKSDRKSYRREEKNSGYYRHHRRRSSDDSKERKKKEKKHKKHHHSSSDEK